MDYAIATIVFAWFGMTIAGLLLLVISWAVGCAGRDLYRRITRVYSLTVVWYWLDKLEREGLRTFEKARQESLRNNGD